MYTLNSIHHAAAAAAAVAISCQQVAWSLSVLGKQSAMADKVKVELQWMEDKIMEDETDKKKTGLEVNVQSIADKILP